MSLRLGGLPALAYVGVEAVQPPNLLYFTKRAPTTNDWKNLNVGTLWLYVGNNLIELWILVSVAHNQGTWVQLYPSSGSGATEFVGNSGPGAVPSAGIITIKGAADGSGNTGALTVAGSGAGNDVVINITPIGYTTDDSSTVTPANNAITIAGAGGITTSSSGNTVTINGGAGASSFPTDSGTATPAAGVLIIKAGSATAHAGSSVSFSGAGHTVTFNSTDSSNNTIVGGLAGNASISGSKSTALGAFALESLTSGSNNVAIGYNAGDSVTSGSNSTLVGYTSGGTVTSGSNNIAIGYQAALNYSSTEASNIIIGNSGSNAESNTIRIGTQGSGAGQQNTAYMAGIYGSTVGGTNGFVVCDNSGKLGIGGIPGSAFTLLETQTSTYDGSTGASSFVFSNIGIQNYSTLFITYKFNNVATFAGPFSIAMVMQASINGGISWITAPNYVNSLFSGFPTNTTFTSTTQTLLTTTIGGTNPGPGISGPYVGCGTGNIWLIGNNNGPSAPLGVGGTFVHGDFLACGVANGTGNATIQFRGFTAAEIPTSAINALQFFDSNGNNFNGYVSVYGISI